MAQKAVAIFAAQDLPINEKGRASKQSGFLGTLIPLGNDVDDGKR